MIGLNTPDSRGHSRPDASVRWAHPALFSWGSGATTRAAASPAISCSPGNRAKPGPVLGVRFPAESPGKCRGSLRNFTRHALTRRGRFPPRGVSARRGAGLRAGLRDPGAHDHRSPGHARRPAETASAAVRGGRPPAGSGAGAPSRGCCSANSARGDGTLGPPSARAAAGSPGGGDPQSPL